MKMSDEERKALVEQRIKRAYEKRDFRIYRKISRTQLEEETITVDELERRLTSFIDKHHGVVL